MRCVFLLPESRPRVLGRMHHPHIYTGTLPPSQPLNHLATCFLSVYPFSLLLLGKRFLFGFCLLEEKNSAERHSLSSLFSKELSSAHQERTETGRPKADWLRYSGLWVVGCKSLFMSTYEVGGRLHGHKMTLFLFQIMAYQISLPEYCF